MSDIQGEGCRVVLGRLADEDIVESNVASESGSGHNSLSQRGHGIRRAESSRGDCVDANAESRLQIAMPECRRINSSRRRGKKREGAETHDHSNVE